MKKRGNERTLYLCLANAVSLGGDSDTLACITGSIAEAYYGIPASMREHALAILPRRIAETLLTFESQYQAV